MEKKSHTFQKKVKSSNKCNCKLWQSPVWPRVSGHCTKLYRSVFYDTKQNFLTRSNSLHDMYRDRLIEVLFVKLNEDFYWKPFITILLDIATIWILIIFVTFVLVIGTQKKNCTFFIFVPLLKICEVQQ